MCIEDNELFWGICPSCGELGREWYCINKRCINAYSNQPIPPQRDCERFAVGYTHIHPIRYDAYGREIMLSGLCEDCKETEQQTATGAGDEIQGVTDDNGNDAESDHGEAELDRLMAGANELQTEHIRQMQEGLNAERQTQEEEAFQRMVEEEPAAHLAEQRQRMREGLEAARFLPLYRQEQPEAIARRIAHEVRERHIHSGSDDASISDESSSSADTWYRPDLSGPQGRMRRGERMDRYFHGTPAEPYDEALAWQSQGCASTTEEEMLEQGYGEGVVNNRWHRYWANANGEEDAISTAAASSRLEHLGEVESRNQDWYYGYRDPDDGP